MNQEVKFGVPAPDEVIALMQAGIVATGILNISIGFIIKTVGKDRVDRVLPPVVTGPVACVIGFGLGKAALDMSFTNGYWGIAFATLIVTVACSHFLQGHRWVGMLPVLIGAISGYLLTVFLAPDQISFNDVANAPIFALPHLTLPSFSGPLLLTAVFSISIMAIATIPESTAHLYQISMYVDALAERQSRPKVILDRHLGVNLVCDGVGDVICGICGGPAGTNYGESNSLMAITRNYSGPALLAAGLMCVLLAFVSKFAAFVGTVPVFVSGGLALYLFGVIGMQGIALMQQNKVNCLIHCNLGSVQRSWWSISAATSASQVVSFRLLLQASRMDCPQLRQQRSSALRCTLR
jgi:uracil permease